MSDAKPADRQESSQQSRPDQQKGTTESVFDAEPTAEKSASEPRSSEPKSLGVHYRTHWRFAAAGGFISAGLAAVFTQPALLLVAIVCVGGVLLTSTTRPPEPTLSIKRSFSTTQPEPGEEVTVETTIKNIGTRPVRDGRLIDRVPPALQVTDGSPRMATPLRPGREQTLTYTVELRRGYHEFSGVYAIISTVSGTIECEYDYPATDILTCRPEPKPLPSVPLRSLTTPYAGRLATTEPGEGTEFFATREYQHGDPVSRLDWRRYAASRELTTVQFRTERSASVVIISDVRPSAYIHTNVGGQADQEGEETAVRDQYTSAADQCVDAASRLFVTLLELDHRVGLATFGPEFWLPPGAGTVHRNRGVSAFGTESALSPSPPPDKRQPVRRRVYSLRSRLPEQTQVIICTPLVDDIIEIGIQLLESAGHEVTVLSPDPTSHKTPGSVVSALERDRRIQRIHAHGIPVIDWSADESLDLVLLRATRQGGS